MGIENGMMTIAEEYLREEENIYIIYIDKNTIKISSDFKSNNIKKNLNSNENLSYIKILI